jgi:hypothetical protein
MLTPFVWVLVRVFSRLAVASNASPDGIGNASRTVLYAGAIRVVTITRSSTNTRTRRALTREEHFANGFVGVAVTHGD